MHRYVIRRILLMIPVLLGVSFILYALMDLAPGDAASILGGESMTFEELELLREQMGLNRPMIVRYLEYMWNLIRGDLGTSMMSKEPVLDLFLQKFPSTVKLALGAMAINLGFSIPLGIYTAKHQGTLADNAAMVGALLGLSIPNFWLGLMLISLFAVQLGWFPTYGANDGFMSYVLPAITVGTAQMASTTRTVRSSMLDVCRQDYLRTARAKGVSEKMVINKHALRNALIPILTLIGAQFGGVLGGAYLTESVFSLPGIGRLFVDSIYNRDAEVVVSISIITCAMVSVIRLIVDILYAYVDPRIKAQYERGGKKKHG